LKPTSRFLLALTVLLPTVSFSFGRVAQQQPKFATDSDEQRAAIADAMKEHSYSISLQNGALTGAGMDFIARNAAAEQFVLFGEEHNVKEFPGIMVAMFAYLHQHDNFNYLAFESDPVSAHVASLPPLRGNLAALSQYAAKYPTAFTFATDQELQMVADVSRISTGHTDALWGLDQSFGVLHALDRLRALPGFHSTPEFVELHKQAEELDLKRPEVDQLDYMESFKTSDLEGLRRQMAPPDGSETQFILDNLVSSSQIYGYYYTGEHYLNGYVREEQMKHLFMREYRAAQASGERNPKVLLKLGHWHVFRGLGPSHLQTLGDFVTEFAVANGADAFSLGTYIRGPWRDVSHQQGLEPIALATDPAAWTIIDFRALRTLVAAGKFGALNPNLLSHIYGFDAALVLGGASTGTYTAIDKASAPPK
jgi:hypothetical protein